MVNNVEIHQGASTIILDSVSFCVDFKTASVQGGHPTGPVFVCGVARAIVSPQDAVKLVAAGVTDLR